MPCVDLGESFQTHIYLQNLASIQPRTSLVKFARSPRTVPFETQSGLLLLAFCEFSFGADIIIITDPPGAFCRRGLLDDRAAQSDVAASGLVT